MSSTFPILDPPPEDQDSLEEAIELFEDAWRRGERPRIDDHVSQAGERRLALLIELVHVELENRLKAGESARVEQYLEQYPDLNADRTVVLELLAAEWEFRSRERPGPALSDYVKRFPQLHAELSSLPAPAPPSHDRAVTSVLRSYQDPGDADASSIDASKTTSDLETRSRYHRLRLHARGGLGVIFAAEDDDLGREVALKQLQWRHARQGDSRRRFLREARITSQLEHPGVVPVYGVGQAADGSPCYAMRLVRGRTLQEAVDRFHMESSTLSPSARSVAFRQLLGRLVSVCNTVAYAHSRGILHRDLKPGNVLLGNFGETLVVDWGLAKESADTEPEPTARAVANAGTTLSDSDATRVGTVIGTPAYMSPEQADGQWDRVGASSDIYSLGVTLYFLLTGRPAFAPGRIEDILAAVRRGEFPRPQQVQPGVCPALEAICLKAMSLRIDDRYGSALALAADLEHWLAGEPVSARREPWSVRLRRWTRRHRTLVTAVAILLVAGIAVGVIAALWIAAAKTAEAAQEREKIASALAEIRHNQLQQAAQEQYLYLIGEADRAWRSGRFDQANDKLSACPSEWRGWEWKYLRGKCQDGLLTLRGHTKEVWSVAYSPDGRLLASASLDNTIKIWDAASGRPLLHLEGHSGPVWAVAFSPDGSRLATGSADGSVRLWDPATGLELAMYGGFAAEIYGIAFSKDGTRLAAALGEQRDRQDITARPLPGEVRVWDLPADREVLVIRAPSGGLSSVAFSPDGKTLATGGFDRRVRLWDATTGKELTTFIGHGGSVRRVAFSPDGLLLASASHDGSVRLWNVAAGTERMQLRGHAAPAWGVAFSPDGKRLASSADDCSIRIWDTALGRTILVLHGHGQGIANIAFSPDGRRLASASDDQSVRIWDATLSNDGFSLCGHESGVVAVAVSGDGTRIVSVASDRTLKVWDPASRRMLLSLPLPAWPLSVALSPKSKHVAVALDNGLVTLCDLETPPPVGEGLRGWRVLRGHVGEVHAVAFSPDGRVLASAARDTTVKLWDVESGKERATLRGHRERVRTVAFSRDGERLASGGDDKTVKVWDLATGRDLLTLTGPAAPVACVAFSADSRRLAAGSLSTKKVISWEPGDITIWDLADGQALHTLRGHLDDVRGLAFSPDGQRLASAGADGHLKLWEPNAGQEILTLHRHLGAVNGVVFTPDGRQIISAGSDGTIGIRGN